MNNLKELTMVCVFQLEIIKALNNCKDSIANLELLCISSDFENEEMKF